jgi:hypothetical protein
MNKRIGKRRAPIRSKVFSIEPLEDRRLLSGFALLPTPLLPPIANVAAVTPPVTTVALLTPTSAINNASTQVGQVVKNLIPPLSNTPMVPAINPALLDAASIGPVANVLSSVTAPVTSVVSTVTQPVVQTVASFVLPALAPVTSVVSSLAPVLNSVTAVVDPLVGTVASIVQPVVQDVTALVTPVLAPLTSTVSAVVDPLLVPVTQLTTSLLGPVLNTVTSVVDPVATGIVDPLLAPVTQLTNNLLGPVLNTVTSVVDPVATGIVDPLLAPVLTPVVQLVGNVTTPVVNDLTKIVDPIVQDVTQVVAPVTGPVAQIVIGVEQQVPPVNGGNELPPLPVDPGTLTKLLLPPTGPGTMVQNVGAGLPSTPGANIFILNDAAAAVAVPTDGTIANSLPGGLESSGALAPLSVERVAGLGGESRMTDGASRAFVSAPADAQFSGSDTEIKAEEDGSWSPQAVDTLAQCSPFDTAALEAALARFLNQVSDTPQVIQQFASLGIAPWIIALVVAGLALEYRRRLARRAQALAGADATLAWQLGLGDIAS